MLSGVEQIAAERERQIAEEKWTPENDDRNIHDELSRAALCYVFPPHFRHEVPVKQGPLGEGYVACSTSEAEWYLPEYWPWRPEDWRPTSRIKELVKAGALIAAEIDRLQRGRWTS